MSAYTITHIDDLPAAEFYGCRALQVRNHFGITGFGTTAWVGAEAGDRVVPEHREAETPDQEQRADEELYAVVRGHARFELDGESHDAPAGTMVFAGSGVNRTAFAEQPGTVVLAIGGRPCLRADTSGSELWAPIAPVYAAGDYTGAVARGREAIEARPESAILHYNVACCESLAGDTSAAIADLRQAIELSEPFRDMAIGDSDFDPIRDQPGFRELVAG